MALDYGAPPCPNSNPRTLAQGQEPCPRSDTYRAIESGNAQTVFGWLFRCRTCGTMFFRASREMGMAGMEAGRMDRLAREAQQKR